MGNLILSKYLTKIFFSFFLSISVILILIVFGHQFILVAKESLKIGLYDNELLPFIGLKILRDSPIIFIFSVLAANTISLNKLNSSSEKIIMNASGIGDFNLIKLNQIILVFSVIISLILSLFVAPWANQRISVFKEESKERPEYVFFHEKQFLDFSKYTFYSNSIKNADDKQVLNDIYLFENKGKDRSVITAKSGFKYSRNNDKKIYLDLYDGQKYKFIDKVEIADIVNFEKFSVLIHEDKPNIHSAKPTPETRLTIDLLKENDDESLAEISFRLNQTLMMTILFFLGVIVSESNSRSTKNRSIIVNLILFISYTNIIILMKNLVKSDTISFVNGIIIPNTFFILIIFILLIYSHKFNLSFFSNARKTS